MTKIMTVSGPIKAEDLGLTSMHEHILCDGSIYRKRFMDLLPPDVPVQPDDSIGLENVSFLKHNFVLCWDAVTMDNEAIMTAEVADFKASGGSAMVDMSPPGLRNNLPAIRRISEKTGIHVITTTGLYAEDSWPEKYKAMTTDEYAEYMLKEIDQGMEDTGIKPGHIKVAIEDGPTEQGIKLLKAVARVSGESGFSATIHQGTMMTPEEVRKITDTLLTDGMKPERTIICHTQDFFVNPNLKTLIQDPDSWKLDLDFVKELLDGGFNISVDCLGHAWDIELFEYVNQTDWQRLAGLYALINSGYTAQIVLGTDTYMNMLVRRFGGEGYCRLTKAIIPMLKIAEVSDETIDQIMVKNPARLLAY